MKQPPARTLVFGLDATGKTTLLYKLVGSNGFKVDTPRIGFRVETAMCGGVELIVWDVGGSDTYRPDTEWPLFEGAHAMIFVVDASDRDRLEAAAAELHRILKHSKLHCLPLLVLLNKQDQENAMGAPEAYGGLHLDRAEMERRVHVQPCSVLSMEGVPVALEWLADAVKQPKPQSQCEAAYGTATASGEATVHDSNSLDTLLAMPDLVIGPQSNVGSLFAEDQLRDTHIAADQRARDGYDANGRLGGPYTQHSPPPGLIFGGYLKGCTGITWVPAQAAVAAGTEARPDAIDIGSDDGPGFCNRCGFSLYHYSGEVCHATGVRHPEWTRPRPPRFADVNG